MIARIYLSARFAPALIAALLSASCAVDEALDSDQQESGVVVTGPMLPPTFQVKFWENHDGSALWPKSGINGAVVVLYPAKRGWGAYLFSQKGNAAPVLIANFQGKINTLKEFLADNVLEWEEVSTPGDDFNHGILGSIKKKPPKGPGDPPGNEFKATHLASAREVAAAALGDLKAQGEVLRVEF